MYQRINNEGMENKSPVGNQVSKYLVIFEDYFKLFQQAH